MNLDLYRDLFVHRDDVFAEQQPDGAYYPVKRPLEDIDLQEHLAGLASYGVYVIDPLRQVSDAEAMRRLLPKEECGKNTVKYAVFDLDTYDESALEFLCQQVYELVVSVDDVNFGSPYKDAQCLLLENSGGKGYHIWLFFSEPLPARQVRAWTEQVRTVYDANKSGAWPSVWPALEIFPKQDAVAEGSFGNLVKLPFGVHAKSGKKSEAVPRQGWAEGVSTVQRLSSSLVPGTPLDRISSDTGTSGSRDGGVSPFACITRIIEDGAPQGNRDNAMFHFAHYAKGTGLPEDLVMEWCERVNQEFDPPLTDSEVETKVHSALGMNSPHPGCKADWLRGFCPGGEHCFAPWADKPERARKSSPERDAAEYLALSPQERRERRNQRRSP